MEIINDNREPRRLYRSRRRIIGGVCQGLADYFNVDVVLVRIIALLLLGRILGLSGAVDSRTARTGFGERRR